MSIVVLPVALVLLWSAFSPVSIPAPALRLEQTTGGGCREVGTKISGQSATKMGANDFVMTSATECALDKASFSVTCTITTTQPGGVKTSTRTVTTYTSLADLIDEVSVVPPLTLASSVVATSGGQPVMRTAHTFDKNRRLTQAVTTSPSGKSTTTYSAWDKAGRPTRVSEKGDGVSTTREISYDDKARTRTTVLNGDQMTMVETFDAAGNQIALVATTPTPIGESTSKTQLSILARERVCK